MHRLLDLAEVLFGPGTRRDVFEPMLADRERELAGARTGATRSGLRVRWAIAIARTFVMCTPDALTVRMPTVLLLDVLGCVGSFSIVALIFQLGASADLIQSEWKSTLIAALSFTVIPIVWRFRVAAIPEHQGRALTRTFILVIGAAVLSLAAGEWAVGAAQVAGIIWLAFVGWRLGTDRAHVKGVRAYLVQTAIVTACLVVASWPPKLALGIDLLEPLTPGQPLLVWAWFTVITMKKRFKGFTSIGP